MLQRLRYFSVPPIVILRILGAMMLIAVVTIYFTGERLGVIPPIFAEKVQTPEEKAELARRNADVKRRIAARQSRAAAVRSADRSDFIAHSAPARSVAAAPKPAAAPESAPEASADPAAALAE